MKGTYNGPEDDFTENDVLAALDAAGLKHKNGSRYILSQCPSHDDRNPSTQIFKDDWFVNCLAGCGRFHITKAFPELLPQALRESQGAGGASGNGAPIVKRVHAKAPEKVKYQQYDLLEYWESLLPLSREMNFKGIPLEILDDLGWRLADYKGVPSIFIPYWNEDRTAIPFGQYRHLEGDRRFTFLQEAEPTVYGKWNFDNPRLFVVEGASDAAVLDYLAVPWIAMPSASSGELMKRVAVWCGQNGVELVYAGDNDAAGDKLKAALDEVTFYRVCQPPKKYKDWGDFFVAEGFDKCLEWVIPEMDRKVVVAEDPDAWWKEAKRTIDAEDAKKDEASAKRLEQPNLAKASVLF